MSSSDPSKDSRVERRKRKAKAAVKLPDREAIRKLFPQQAVKRVEADAKVEPKPTQQDKG